LSNENLGGIQWLRGGVASEAWLLIQVASLDSTGWILLFLSRIHLERMIRRRNRLLCLRLITIVSRDGFQVDSPVKKPVASEMPRCAPPYTFGGREEPWQRGRRKTRKRLQIVSTVVRAVAKLSQSRRTQISRVTASKLAIAAPKCSTISSARTSGSGRLSKSVMDASRSQKTSRLALSR